MSRSRRRPRPGRVLLWLAPLAAAAVGATVVVSPNRPALTLHDAADAGTSLQASYQAGANWGTGYSGQYTITNAGTAAVNGWTLAFAVLDGAAGAGVRLSVPNKDRTE